METLINKFFRVSYHTEAPVVDGEFQPDVFKTKDFNAHTAAVAFGKKHCASLIEEIEQHRVGCRIVNKHTGRKWECTNRTLSS